MTVVSASTSKKRRRFGRVSLRPKPSVPSVVRPPGTQEQFGPVPFSYSPKPRRTRPLHSEAVTRDMIFLGRQWMQHIPALDVERIPT